MTGQKLVNNLSVQDALHLVRTEGGELTPGRIFMRLAMVVVVAAFTARAIWVGKATALHLFLPMLAEYIALVFALPVLRMTLPDDGLRKEARSSVRLLIAITVVGSIWIAVGAAKSGMSWGSQLAQTARLTGSWIVDHQMHWPMLGAAVGILLALPGRVQMLRKHGPPFLPVGLGCAMRLVILIFGAFLIPWIWGSSLRLTWALWAVLVLAEVGAVWVHWDVQQHLRKRGVKV